MKQHKPLKSMLQMFSTCPQSKDVPITEYYDKVIEVARWSEDAGFEGILIYTDNGLVDNWSIAQVVLENTERISPLIAVQPIYVHPYMLAKRIVTLSHLYGRKLYLNMLAGGFNNDLTALGDDTPHDERYARTVEYTLILRALLENDGPVTFEGNYYQVKNLKMTPSMPKDLQPGILISGSSEAGMQASRDIGASAIRYPKPVREETIMHEPVAPGIRLGIIARDKAEDAWEIAYDRFPATRQGQLAHQLAMKVSDSVWHHELSDLDEKPAQPGNPYWLRPFQNYQTFCPYLVGTYDRVAEELGHYRSLGFEVFITDIPTCKEDLYHIQQVVDRAIMVAS
ncbi:MAG: LLM class flavin-dependent oxidoreductase [Trueperaceae bacterium]|nr:LLM class flavin-dependent oxidoreductase [Trueperaceae bacterium]